MTARKKSTSRRSTFSFSPSPSYVILLLYAPEITHDDDVHICPYYKIKKHLLCTR